MSERALPTGTVRFLFTDIEGSTELLKQLGDQAYGDVLARHQVLLRQAFAQEQGRRWTLRATPSSLPSREPPGDLIGLFLLGCWGGG